MCRGVALHYGRIVQFTLNQYSQGLMAGIELRSDWSNKGLDVTWQLMERGFIVNYQPHNATFRLFPPYIISTRQIDGFLDGLDRILSTLST